jgi:hypothetical protein
MTSNNNLADLVPEYLKPLAPLEEKLLKAAPFGSEVSDFEPDEPIDKNQLGEVQSIRSELLIWLLTDSAARVMIHHKGINLRGAKVAGILDLEDSSIDYPLRLRECVIEEEMILARGDYKLLDFSGCQTGSIDADSIHVQYDVLMMGGFKAKGEVRLRGADIGGNLRCDGGEFENPKGYAFYGDNLKTNGNVFLRAGFKTKGEARLLGASIGGNLECDGGELENPRGYALSADNLTAKGNVFLRSGFKTKGGVRFPRAEIGGSFECDGAELENPGGYALHGDGLTTKGSLFLRNGFKAKGEVRLRAATLGGNLECSGGEFEDPKGLICG